MKIAGVIVTYNRKELLLRNIQMQANQIRKVDRLYIIDNHSSDNSKDLVESTFGKTDWIDYVYLEENTGGAGGFYEGTKRAFEDGFDYVWLMDDDGRPYNENTLSELLSVAEVLYPNNKKLLLNSLVTVENNTLSFGFGPKNIREQFEYAKSLKKPNNYILNVANPFNGTLVSKETIQKVGYPNKLFFIARDETDYFRRCEDNDVLIATVTTSIYHHPNGVCDGWSIFNKFVPFIDSTNKQYYWIRNLTYSYKDRHKCRMIIYDFLLLLTIVFVQDQKKIRLSNWSNAIKDAFNGKMGKRIESQ